MGFLGRSALGALGTGGYKAWQGDSWGGITKGAAVGALVGGVGGHYGMKLARNAGRGIKSTATGMFGKMNRIAEGLGKKVGVAHMARKASGYAAKAASAGSRAGARGYYGSRAGGFLGGGSLFRASNAVGMGAVVTNRFIGNNVAAVNKYGGYAMGAMGAAAAVKIGSSVLSSNNNRRR